MPNNYLEADPTFNMEDRPEVQLVGRDGNAFAVMGAAKQAARTAGWSQGHIQKYLQEAMEGDYNHLLQVTMKYFDVS